MLARFHFGHWHFHKTLASGETGFLRALASGCRRVERPAWRHDIEDPRIGQKPTPLQAPNLGQVSGTWPGKTSHRLSKHCPNTCLPTWEDDKISRDGRAAVCYYRQGGEERGGRGCSSRTFQTARKALYHPPQGSSWRWETILQECEHRHQTDNDGAQSPHTM